MIQQQYIFTYQVLQYANSICQRTFQARKAFLTWHGKISNNMFCPAVYTNVHSKSSYRRILPIHPVMVRDNYHHQAFAEHSPYQIPTTGFSHGCRALIRNLNFDGSSSRAAYTCSFTTPAAAHFSTAAVNSLSLGF